MNARILHTIWKLQRTSSVIRNLSQSRSLSKCSYATGILFRGASTVQNQVKCSTVLLIKKPQTNNYSAQTAVKTSKIPSVEFLLQNIEGSFQRNGYVQYESFCKLLNALEEQPHSYNQLLRAEQVLFLLGACGSLLPSRKCEQRLELFARLWKYLEDNKQLRPEHFLTALEVHRLNRSFLSNFQDFVKQLIELDTSAVNGTLYELLLEAACESGNMRQATEILADMREKQLALTERTFNALIVGHSRTGDIIGVKSVLDNMSAANVPLSLQTQSLLVCAYLENNQTSNAIEILKQFQGQFESHQVLYMLKMSLLVNVGQEAVDHLIHELPEDLSSGQELSIPLRNICIELVHNGKIDAATMLINALPKPHFNDNQNIDTYGVFLLHELFRIPQIENTKILEICTKLIESGKNTRALHVAAEVATRRSPPLALPFFEALASQESLRPHYFWPLFMYNFRRHSESGIQHTLKIMTKMQVDCDDETFTNYVLPRLSITLEDPTQAVKSLAESGIKVTKLMPCVLMHLLAQQKLEQALELTHAFPTRLDCMEFVPTLANIAVYVRATKRYHVYVKILQILTKTNVNPKADFIGQLLLEIISKDTRLRSDTFAMQRLLKEMNKFGLQLSATAIEMISTQLQQHINDTDLTLLTKTLNEMSNRKLSLPNSGDTDVDADNVGATPSALSSSFIKHPRDMTMNELECHLIELEAKGMNTRGVLRRLLQLCVRDGRLERALEVKKRCDELRIQLSPGMAASIFDMYIKLKDLPNATASLKQLQTSFPGFNIDEHKIIDYAALLVHEGQLEAGKRVLSERAAMGKIIGGDYIIRNVWNFLTNVANSASNLNLPKEENLTRDTFLFMQRLRFCNAHNAVLGPIVREYLLRNDIHSAVEEFERLAEKYKHTPLQFELITLLVRLSNANEVDMQLFQITEEEAKSLLTKVTDVVANVHTVVNMNSALLLAFAASGTDKQLRRLLINPEFRINQEMLIKNCEHLGQEGAVNTLLRLARGARGLHHVISEQSIYNLLLANHVKANNYAAAIDLFQRLDADDELKITQEFLKKLVNLLKVNNVEIPSNIALRAQIME